MSKCSTSSADTTNTTDTINTISFRENIIKCLVSNASLKRKKK